MPNTRSRTVEEEIRFREIASTHNTIVWPTWVLNEHRRLLELTVIGLTLREAERILSPDVVEAHIRANRMWWIGEAPIAPTAAPATATPAPVAVPVVQPVRIRVRVHKTSEPYSTWEVSVKVDGTTQNLPSVKVIKTLLPQEDKHYLPSRVSRYTSSLSYLKQALEAGLSAQSLHDSLKAWAIAKLSAPTTVESDSGLDSGTEALLKAQPATLEVAGRIYKLVPCGSIDTRPMIAKVRKKALATVAVESEAIKARAAVDARVVVNEAETRATQIRAEADEIRRRANETCPQWIIDGHRVHFFDGAYWNVQLHVSCLLRDIRLTVGEWNHLILHWTPLPMPDFCPMVPLWVKLGADGAFNNRSIFMSGGYQCPHIGSFMCMELQGMPRAATSNGDLMTVESCIGRGMQVINMNSLLAHNPAHYWPPILAQIPPMVLRLIRGECSIHPNYIRTPSGRERRETPEEFRVRVPTITWDSAETIREENDGTFSTDNPPPVIQPVAVEEG